MLFYFKLILNFHIIAPFKFERSFLWYIIFENFGLKCNICSKYNWSIISYSRTVMSQNWKANTIFSYLISLLLTSTIRKLYDYLPDVWKKNKKIRKTTNMTAIKSLVNLLEYRNDYLSVDVHDDTHVSKNFMDSPTDEFD